MKTEREKINYIVSTIRTAELPEDFIVVCTEILCQFDTDIAIKVMEELGEHSEAMSIKVNYGY